jgi:hypothetical protein
LIVIAGLFLAWDVRRTWKETNVLGRICDVIDGPVGESREIFVNGRPIQRYDYTYTITTVETQSITITRSGSVEDKVIQRRSYGGFRWACVGVTEERLYDNMHEFEADGRRYYCTGKVIPERPPGQAPIYKATIYNKRGTICIPYRLDASNEVDLRDLLQQIMDYWTLSNKPIPLAFALVILCGVGLAVLQIRQAVLCGRQIGAAPAANAASLVSGPAIVLLVVGILDVAVGVLSFFLLLSVTGAIHSSGWLILGSLIITGAWRMKKRNSYGFAMTACIVAMAPLFNICVLGLPFGIWGLVVLLNPGIIAAFHLQFPKEGPPVTPA